MVMRALYIRRCRCLRVTRPPRTLLHIALSESVHFIHHVALLVYRSVATSVVAALLQLCGVGAAVRSTQSSRRGYCYKRKWFARVAGAGSPATKDQRAGGAGGPRSHRR